MEAYLTLVREVLDQGLPRQDRTGTGTLGVFGRQVRFNLGEGFPLLTTKKLHLKSIIVELLWFLSGGTNISYLHKYGVTIWDNWADKQGELGPIYGAQWRSWRSPDGKVVDQISQLLASLRHDPFSRRHILNSWNVGELDKMALLPCHCLCQFYVTKNQLSCLLFQRSADLFLGVPFNIASYALLTMMMAQVLDLAPGELVHTFGDLHLYRNHLKQARLQLTRQPRPLPQMKIDPQIKDLFAFSYESFRLEGYDPHPHIPGEVSV